MDGGGFEVLLGDPEFTGPFRGRPMAQYLQAWGGWTKVITDPKTGEKIRVSLEKFRHLDPETTWVTILRRTDITTDLLRDLAPKDFSFVAEALAANLSTPSDVLRELVPATVGGRNANRLLKVLAVHPHADSAVLEACAVRVTEALSQQHDQGHPYAAALALAGRPEVPHATVQEWMALPGASARFRHGLQTAIDGRALNT